jgi:tetratricopeptide (TPR) repeat protein
LWLSGASVSFFLAFCSKESALAWVPFVPCYVLARAWRAEANARVGTVLRTKGAAMALAILPAVVLFFVLRYFVTADATPGVTYLANPLYHEETAVRLLTAIKLQGYGLWQSIAPFSLAALYGIRSVELVRSPADPGFLVAGVALLLFLVVALRSPARRPLLFLSAALFFGFGFITSNVPFAIGTIYGERLLFIPSLGVCMLPALLLHKLGPTGRRILLGACGVWVAANVVVDVQRCLAWRDNETLLSVDSAAQPDCAALQITAAKYFHVLEQRHKDRKQFFRDKAWEAARRARAADPKCVDAVATEAELLGAEKKFDAAIAKLREALGMDRLQISGLESSIRDKLGRTLLLEKKQTHAGLLELQRALALNPGDFDLRLLIIDRGRATLPKEILRQLITDGLVRHPGSISFALLEADFLFRNAPPQARGEIAQVLQEILQHVPPANQREKRFVVAWLQLGECLMYLGHKQGAQRAFETVLANPGADASHKKRARDGLAALER